MKPTLIKKTNDAPDLEHILHREPDSNRTWWTNGAVLVCREDLADTLPKPGYYQQKDLKAVALGLDPDIEDFAHRYPSQESLEKVLKPDPDGRTIYLGIPALEALVKHAKDAGVGCVKITIPPEDQRPLALEALVGETWRAALMVARGPE